MNERFLWVKKNAKRLLWPGVDAQVEAKSAPVAVRYLVGWR